MNHQITFTTEDVHRSQEKLLNRMVELGWVSRFGWNEVTRKVAIDWTPLGRQFLVPFRVTLDSLGCQTADELCALEGLVHNKFVFD